MKMWFSKGYEINAILLSLTYYSVFRRPEKVISSALRPSAKGYVTTG
jgi:hypothetical protein